MLIPDQLENASITNPADHTKRGWRIAVIMIIVAVALTALLWFVLAHKNASKVESKQAEEATQENVVERKPDEPEVKIFTATSVGPPLKVAVTGTVEPNDQQVQQLSSLAAGRVESVDVSLGDHVTRGQAVITIKSPQVAETHGKLHEAEAKLKLARATLFRVKQAANRVAILKAKASLDEAVATLKRVEQLVAEGLSARKDLVSAQSEFERATAEFNFQKNISLNKEVAEAEANVKTTETETEHIKDSLAAMDAELSEGDEGSEHKISELTLKAPISGAVIERLVNPGAGVEAGKPLLTIANTEKLWVIANVPEIAMSNISLGMTAKVTVNNRTIMGKVSFIDPRLNEDTRTSRVRVIIENSSRPPIQTGSFAQVEFNRRAPRIDAVYVPVAAVQTISGKKIVFVQQNKKQFKVRDVTTGEEVDGFTPITSGLKVGEVVSADGSFILKSKLMKSELGDND